MSDEYTLCPGSHNGAPCGSVVKVWPGDSINFCCRPCWQTSWEPIQEQLNGHEDQVALDYGHSEQCWDRQSQRRGVPVVMGRLFKTAGPREVPGVR